MCTKGSLKGYVIRTCLLFLSATKGGVNPVADTHTFFSQT